MSARIRCQAPVRGWEDTEECNKPAVTYALPVPWCDDDSKPWPVCSYHAHLGTALPLHKHPERTER